MRLYQTDKFITGGFEQIVFATDENVIMGINDSPHNKGMYDLKLRDGKSDPKCSNELYVPGQQIVSVHRAADEMRTFTKKDFAKVLHSQEVSEEQYKLISDTYEQIYEAYDADRKSAGQVFTDQIEELKNQRKEAQHKVKSIESRVLEMVQQ